MLRRSLGRAAALALTGLMAFTGLASADVILTDGDALEGQQSTVDIGTVAPGATVTVPVDFLLRCSTSNHADHGQTITLSLMGSSAAPGGAVLGVTPGTIGPIPDHWPADGSSCGEPQETLASTTAARITLRAPTLPNVGYTYTVGFTRTYSPMGNLDGSAVNLTPSIVILLDVAANTAPTLTLPSDVTLEGDTTGGALAAFTVSATDLHDDPEPTPTCDVEAGDVVPLGTTTVTCTVTDSGGLSTTGSFDITVEDKTDPVFVDPDDVLVTTGDPTGAVVEYPTPVATDIVDADPTVDCLPRSGERFAVGTTPVTCTAIDDSDNTATSTFDVVVDHVQEHAASATWLEPVSGGQLVANRGRNVPVKVVLRVDGDVRTTGDARLQVTPCGGGTATVLPLTYGGGRWNASLDTGPLSGPCHTVTAAIDGLTAGRFELDLRGGEPAATKAKAKGK